MHNLKKYPSSHNLITYIEVPQKAIVSKINIYAPKPPQVKWTPKKPISGYKTATLNYMRTFTASELIWLDHSNYKFKDMPVRRLSIL